MKLNYIQYIISCIIALGSRNNGGDTDYYDGINNNMFGVKQILVLCKHCQSQNGCYNKIYHGVCSWYCDSITALHWILIKKKIIDYSQL